MKRITACLAVAILVAVLLGACSKPVTPLTVADLLDLGEKYLLEMNYEQAVVQFLKVIEVEPMNPRGYTGAAEAYSRLDRTAEAIDILQQGYDRTRSDSIKDMLLDLEVDEEIIRSLAPQLSASSSESNAEDGNNLTSRLAFTSDDLEAWGYPWGMSALDCVEKHGELFEPKEVYVSGNGENYTYYEEPSLWVAEWVQEAKQEQDPHPGSGSCLVYRSDITVSFYAKNQLIMAVDIINESELKGPRGLSIGMSMEEVLNLLRCDEPLAIEYAKTFNTNYLNACEGGYELELYNDYTSNVLLYAYLKLWNEKTYIDYQISNDIMNVIFSVDFDNEIVANINVHYDYR